MKILPQQLQNQINLFYSFKETRGCVSFIAIYSFTILLKMSDNNNF